MAKLRRSFLAACHDNARTDAVGPPMRMKSLARILEPGARRCVCECIFMSRVIPPFERCGVVRQRTCAGGDGSSCVALCDRGSVAPIPLKGRNGGSPTLQRRHREVTATPWNPTPFGCRPRFNPFAWLRPRRGRHSLRAGTVFLGAPHLSHTLISPHTSDPGEDAE